MIKHIFIFNLEFYYRLSGYYDRTIVHNITYLGCRKTSIKEPAGEAGHYNTHLYWLIRIIV